MDYSFHNIIANKLTAFGSHFENIFVKDYDEDSNILNNIKVPLAYSNKDKFLQSVERRGDNPNNFEDNIKITVPRLGFEIVDLKYNFKQKLNRLHKFVEIDYKKEENEYVYSYVPYKAFINLYVLTNKNDHDFQIIEQILPRFTTFISHTMIYQLSNNLILEFDESINLINPDRYYEEQENFDNDSRILTTFRFESDIKFFRKINTLKPITTINFNFKSNSGSVLETLEITENG